MSGGRFLPATEHKSKLSCLERITCSIEGMNITIHPTSTSDTLAPAELSDNRHLAGILCGDGEFHLT